jgi:hypothetical protein
MINIAITQRHYMFELLTGSPLAVCGYLLYGSTSQAMPVLGRASALVC